jgi:hypothetical protein
MQNLKSLLLFAGTIMFGGLTSAFATDVDVITGVESLPASQSRSTATQATYVRYKVTLAPYPNYTGETFEPVYFTATTSVLSGPSGDALEADASAPFELPLPLGCVLAGPTTINCTFTPGLTSAGFPSGSPPASPPKVFTVIVKTPLAGGRIKVTSETRWFEVGFPHYCYGPAPTFPLPAVSPPCYETEGEISTYTTLTVPDPTVVETYVPVAGGTVTTGSQGGAATCAGGALGSDPNKWVTIVRVPEPAQVGVNLNRVPVVDDDVPPNTIFFSRIQIPDLVDLLGAPQLFGVGTRWYDHDAKSKLVVNTLRRDKCTIGSGLGTLKDALLILKEKIYYKPDIAYPPRVPENPPVYKRLHLCLVTSGPYPGEPCIVYAKVYSKFNLPNAPNKLDYLGDHEWLIFSNENGKIAPGK